jgi:hypothetical protein
LGDKESRCRSGPNPRCPLARLLDEGAIMTVQHIADLEPARGTAILAVQSRSYLARFSLVHIGGLPRISSPQLNHK